MRRESILGAMGILALAATTATCSSLRGREGTAITGGIVSGHVHPMGQASGGVAGAVVHLGSATATTNEQGWFVFSDVAATDRALLSVVHTGYAEALEPITVRDGGSIHQDIVLIPVTSTGTVSATSGGSLSVGSGTQISFPGGAFVDGNGRTVSGDVTIRVSVLDPTTGAGLEAFPGDFEARRTDGTSTLLETYVLASLRATQGTQDLNLASGKAASITIAIPTGAQASAPASIPLWSLDPATGSWKEEGVSTRSGTTYTASIPHLSWWNWDAPMRDRTTCIRGCIVSANDARAIANARVVATGVDYRGQSVAYTGADGCFAMNVGKNSQVRIVASWSTMDSAERVVMTENVTRLVADGVSACQDIGNLALGDVAAQFMLTWGERPSDLDSHLTGPDLAGGSTRYHVYYGSKGSLTAAPYAFLDTDDTTSYGPEVVTLTRVGTGTYRYAIHNFSGQASGTLESSQAVIVVTIPRLGYLRRFDVPASNPDSSRNNVWRVIDVTATNGVVTSVAVTNDFANSSDTSAYNP